MVGQIPHLEEPYPELNVPLTGRYQVVEILAAKAWMRTYLAQDLHRPSRPECIIRHFQQMPMVPNYIGIAEGLFAAEAAALEYLGTHPQIPQLLACFQDRNGFYSVHEWVDGISLDVKWRSQPRLSTEEVIALLQSVLEPLAFVHRSGNIHGKLLPNHLLRRRQDGQWMLIDFSGMQNIQLALAIAYGLEISPEPASKQVYQAPEQIQGLICPANDVYALGLIAIQALTGQSPIAFPKHPEAIGIGWRKFVTSDGSPRQDALLTVLDEMVQWDVSKRFATAQEVQLQLESRLQHLKPLSQMSVALSELSHSMQPNLQEFRGDDVDIPIVPVKFSTADIDFVDPRQETALVALQTHSRDHVPESESLVTTISHPVVRVSFGGMTVAAAFAAVGWGLLNSLDWAKSSPHVEQGNPQASAGSPQANLQSANKVSQRWREQWQKGLVSYQKAELALSQKQWAEVKQWVAEMPDIPYWRNQGDRLTRQVIAQAEPESFQLLQSAYQSAQEKNFTVALTKLNQIVPGTSVEAIAKAKLAEYREKQNIKAAADLQKAFERAIVRDFTKALAYLYQIPEGTSAYELAQQKITEYKYKEKIRAQTFLQAADAYAQKKEWMAAIAVLEALPPEVALSSDVEQRHDVYIQQLNAQANQTLQFAERQIHLGHTTTAIETLKQVPIGTTAYAQARDRLAELMNPPRQMPQQEATKPYAVNLQSSSLNPGDRLQGV